MATDMQVIWVKSEPEYFSEGDWTPQIRLRLKENFVSIVIRRCAIAHLMAGDKPTPAMMGKRRENE